MTIRRNLLPFALLVAVGWAWSSMDWAGAQEADGQKGVAESPDNADGWYYRSPADAAPQKTIVQQKAAFRAEQRMARLSAQQWYGYSNARPQVTAVPFTSMYRSAWQRPGGWPYRWSFRHQMGTR